MNKMDTTLVSPREILDKGIALSDASKTYMTDKVGPLPFCPGCGHTLLIKALDKAIVKLQPDPGSSS